MASVMEKVLQVCLAVVVDDIIVANTVGGIGLFAARVFRVLDVMILVGTE